MTEWQRRKTADDGTDPVFLKTSTERYLLVKIMAGFFTPNTSTHTGADCSGSSGATSRVLTLSNTALSSQEQVVVDSMVLESGHDYTISHLAASSTITFTGKVWDTQRIVVRFFT